jgi:hypothetical protein
MEQTVFIKGRDISDNTIFMRKVIHTFNTKEYQHESSVLKADINKAFDMIE